MTSGPDNPNFFDFLDDDQQPEEGAKKPEDAADDEMDGFFDFFSDESPENAALRKNSPNSMYPEDSAETPEEKSPEEDATENTPVWDFLGEDAAEESSDENASGESDADTDAEESSLEGEFFSEDAFSEEDAAEDEFFEDAEETDADMMETLEEIEFPTDEEAAQMLEEVAEEDAGTEELTEEDAAADGGWGGFTPAAEAEEGEAGLPEAVAGGFSFGSFSQAVAEETPAEELAADDRLVRVPDSDQEFRLSELIDVATGEPLDLRSLIPAGTVRAAVEADAGYGLAGGFGGAAAFGAGGFSAGAAGFGADAATVGEGVPRKTAVRKTQAKKKSAASHIFPVVLGGLLSLPVVQLLLMVIGIVGWGSADEKNALKIPTPFFPATYHHLMEKDSMWSWMPTWLLPGYDAAVHGGQEADEPPALHAPAAKSGENPEAKKNGKPAPPVNPTDEEVVEDTTADEPEDTFDPNFDPMGDEPAGPGMFGDGGLEDTETGMPMIDVPEPVTVPKTPAETLKTPAETPKTSPEAAAVGAKKFAPPVYGETELKAAVDAKVSLAAMMNVAEKMTFFVNKTAGSSESWKKAQELFTTIGKSASNQKSLNAATEKAIQAKKFGTGVFLSGTVKSVETKGDFQVVQLALGGDEANLVPVISPQKNAKLVAGAQCVLAGVLLDASQYPDIKVAAGKPLAVWRGEVLVK